MAAILTIGGKPAFDSKDRLVRNHIWRRAIRYAKRNGLNLMVYTKHGCKGRFFKEDISPYMGWKPRIWAD
jgi:hypothetical protein